MKKLKIAIQKSGRLSEKSLELLQECNIKLTNGNRQLISVSSNFPIEILYLRDDDIPQCIYDGVADLGIVGKNEFLEKNFDFFSKLFLITNGKIISASTDRDGVVREATREVIGTTD